MIGDVLGLLRKHLNEDFRSHNGAEEATEDPVVALDGDQRPDSINFKLNAVSMLVYNIEHETMMREGDPYLRIDANGTPRRTHPYLAINLHILFVARFKDYEQAWQHLSGILKYFLVHKRLDHSSIVGLPDEIDHLIIEFTTLELPQQSELWGLLRTSYLPSVAYRVKTIIFQDRDTATIERVTKPPTIQIKSL
jgi:hypothetical protein